MIEADKTREKDFTERVQYDPGNNPLLSDFIVPIRTFACQLPCLGLPICLSSNPSPRRGEGWVRGMRKPANTWVLKKWKSDSLDRGCYAVFA